MADQEKHPYYKLDSGAPHMDENDYRTMGLGSVQQASATCPDRRPSSTPEEDRQLRQSIELKLHDNGFVDESRISVSVREGKVRLEGTTENRYGRSRAEDLANEVGGVASVDNHIAIQPTTDDDHPNQPALTTHMPGIVDGSAQRS